VTKAQGEGVGNKPVNETVRERQWQHGRPMSRKKRLVWESQDTESSEHRRLPVGPDARAGLGGERRKGGKEEQF
jgi:hypothetical protein